MKHIRTLDILCQRKIRNKLINFGRWCVVRSKTVGKAPEIPAKPGLEWAFTLEASFDLAIIHASVAGEKGFLRVGGGRVFGPRLEGALAEQAGDWPLLRRDGIVESDARYMIRATDGELVYMRSRGYLRVGDLEIFRSASTPSEPLYFRCAPQFDTSVGPHQWLARSVFVGSGRLSRQGARIDIFEVL